MPVSESQHALDVHTGQKSLSVQGRRAFQVAVLTLLGIAFAFTARYWAAASPTETVAVIRQRRTLAKSEDPAVAIERITRQILSPASLVAALRDASPSPLPDESLAAAAESLRSQLRVEVQPGAGRQPWIISIGCANGARERADVLIVNRLAENYAQASESAEMAQRKQAYEAARAASRRAAKWAEKSQREVDRQIDRLAQFVEVSRRSVSAAADQAAQPPPVENEGDEKHAELAAQLAELEARRLAMLERLLPAHPEVLALDVEIDALRAQTAQLPSPMPLPAAAPRIKSDVGSSSATESIADELQQTWSELNSQRKVLADAMARSSQLAAVERLAAEQLQLRAHDEILTLSPPALSQPSAAHHLWAFAAVACLAGLLAGSTWGRPKPRASDAFHDAEELELALGVPLVGVLDGR